jgi:hypothetical protein
MRNKTVFRMTAETGGVKRESVNLGGTAAQRAMVNHGPDVAMVQKYTGRSFTAGSVREVSQRTTVRTASNHAETVHPASRDKDNPDLASNHGPDHGDGSTRDGFDSGPRGKEGGGHGGGHGKQH